MSSLFLFSDMSRVETSDKGIESVRMKQSRFVRLIALLIQFAVDEGYQITFADAFAKTGHMEGSLHYIRLAIDLNIFKGNKYITKFEEVKEIGEYWESLGGSWGGRFGDVWHFSLEHKGKK